MRIYRQSRSFQRCVLPNEDLLARSQLYETNSRTAHMCEQPSYTTQHATVTIIFPLNLQTISWKRVEPARKVCQRSDASSHVDGEEPEPHGTEDADDDHVT